MRKGGENNYFEGRGQDKYKLRSQAPDKDWQPEERSVTKLRAHLQLVRRSNEALGDARWEDMGDGAASHKVSSQA